MKKPYGLTLIEMLLVVGIIVIIATISTTYMYGFKVRSHCEATTDQLTQGMRRAQMRSMAMEDDSQYGVHIETGQFTVFKGTDWVSRDSAYDEATEMADAILLSGSDVIFNKLSGQPDSDGSVTITCTDISQVHSVIATTAGKIERE